MVFGEEVLTTKNKYYYSVRVNISYVDNLDNVLGFIREYYRVLDNKA